MSLYDDPDYIAERRIRANAAWRPVLRHRLIDAVASGDTARIAELLPSAIADLDSPRDIACCIGAGAAERHRLEMREERFQDHSHVGAIVPHAAGDPFGRWAEHDGYPSHFHDRNGTPVREGERAGEPRPPLMEVAR